MPSLLSTLSNEQQRQLLDDLNYLNTNEIKTFCKRRRIPYTIWIETKEGARKTPDEDRKGVILNRIRHYLRTGRTLSATCFPASIVCLEGPLKKRQATDRLFYGQYDKKNAAMMGLLEQLTAGQFKDGAIARIVAREFWGKGIAPTFREYARAWLKAKENHKRPNPEWAFLSDRADGKATADWKQLRAKKAKQVLYVLNRLAPK